MTKDDVYLLSALILGARWQIKELVDLAHKGVILDSDWEKIEKTLRAMECDPPFRIPVPPLSDPWLEDPFRRSEPVRVGECYGTSYHELLATYCSIVGRSLARPSPEPISRNYDWSNPDTFAADQPRDLAWQKFRQRIVQIVTLLNSQYPAEVLNSPSFHTSLRIELADAITRAMPTKAVQLRTPDQAWQDAEGLTAGCGLRFEDVRGKLSKGNEQELTEYMWARDQATYRELDGPVFDGDVRDGTVRVLTSRVSKKLKDLGVNWRLSADAKSKLVTKEYLSPASVTKESTHQSTRL